MIASKVLAAVTVLAAASSCASDRASCLDSKVGRQHNESLLWGPYKPNLYFGVRPRLPRSLWTGLMWGRIDDYPDVKDGLRYTCEQGEELHGYGWDEYDPRHGGVQTIHDVGNNIDLKISFAKFPGGEHGGSWGARVRGELRDGAPESSRTVIYQYIAQEDDGELTPQGEGDDLGFTGDVTFRVRSESLGQYELAFARWTGNAPADSHPDLAARPSHVTVVNSAQQDEDDLWQARPLLFQQLQAAALTVRDNLDPDDAPPPPWQVYRITHKPGQGNSHFIQRTFEGPFEFDVLFSSKSAASTVTSEDLTKAIEAASTSFSARFSSVFTLQSPYTTSDYRDFAKHIFSSLLGGVGYFSGEQLIDRSGSSEYEERSEEFWEDTAAARQRQHQELEGPYELFTMVPSRPFFPRGFLWDEGFHLALVADWDVDLTLDIVDSWFRTMDKDGWIPREQILGPEARSKVPAEFQVQYPHYANPPTLFLVIDDFVDRLRKVKASGAGAQRESSTLHTAHLDEPILGEHYLRHLYPLLRRHYDWFRKTQHGEIKRYDREAYSPREAYRWRGRTVTHILPSGLDDYPRPQPPHPGELHVDLMSWVGLMTKSLRDVAEILGLDDDVAEFTENLDAVQHNLNDLHWSEQNGCFCDATVDAFEEHALVCHKGYVSLFPFLTGLLSADDPKLGKVLGLIADEEHLWSPHGIRSLSKQDEFFGTKENYWRGAVWMPINYMILKQLQALATRGGPYQGQARSMYSKLRGNLVDTVYASWKETGFVWEQYNPDTGAGQRTQYFTGWTSLVVKIMAMEDLEEHARDEL